MAKEQYRISVTEMSFNDGRKKDIKINIDGRDVHIPVDSAIFACSREQFLRTNPPPNQRRRFSTVMNVTRAAYQKGYADAARQRRN